MKCIRKTMTMVLCKHQTIDEGMLIAVAHRKIVDKALTLGLCSTLLFGQIPSVALASETAGEEQVQGRGELENSNPNESLFEQFTFEDTLDTTNEDLFAGYVEKTLYEPLNGGMVPFGNFGETHLSTLELFYYHELKQFIEDIAAGEQEITAIEIPISEYGASDLGKPFNELTGDDLNAALNMVFHTLLIDCPYDLYWFDKTEGVKGEYRTTSGRPLPTTTLIFIVSEDYRTSTGTTSDAYTVNTNLTRAASQTASQAQSVVNQYAALSDYDKIVAYKNWVCSQVAYDESASNSIGYYGDPWQVISVFDNNPATNVVCEGYAKAFQYLCDLSTFTSSSTRSYLVDGAMGREAHMWNVVTLTGAQGTANYLVDLTNTDNDGAPDKTGVFLNGAVSGSIPTGYTFRHSTAGNLTYRFDDDQKALYGTDPASILNLSLADYVPGANIPDEPQEPEKPADPDTDSSTPSTPDTDPELETPVAPEKPVPPTSEGDTHLTGWVQKGNSWYYYDAKGNMQTGWVQNGETWYYCNASGVMQTGWLQLGKTWYYLKSSGAMATGWYSVGGAWYYFAGNGAMKTGWMQDGKTWYYLTPSGAMQTGWLQLGKTWYHFNGSGAMHTGWQSIGGTWYYFYESGAMATGWKQLSGSWYYFNASGAMLTGWQLIGGTWYYFYGSGAMAANTSVGGYKLSASGAMV